MGYLPTGSLTSGGGVNQPANPAQPSTLNWINALDLSELNRVLKPDVLPVLIKRYGKQGFSGMFRNTFGATTSISGQKTFSHWEEDFIHGRIILAETTVGGGPGDPVTFNVGSDDRITFGQTNPPYIGSGTTTVGTPFVNAVIQFSNGIEGVITAVASDFTTFTAYPVDGDESFPSVSNGDSVIIKRALVGEGAGKVQSRNSRLIQFENVIENVRDDHEISDIAASSMLWFDVPSDIRTMSGPLRQVWTHKAFGDAYLRHMNGIDLALLDGKRISNTQLAAVLPTTTKTEGLIQIIETSGNVKDYTIGNMTLDDLDDLILSFRRFKAPTDMYVPCGYEFFKDINALVREGDGVDLFAADTPGRINFANFSGGTQEINLDISVVTRTGYRLALDPQGLFDDPELLGNVDKYKHIGIFMPVGSAVRYNENDPTTAETVPGLELVSLRNPRTGGAWLYDDFITGSLFGTPTDDVSVGRYHLRSYVGLRLAGVNRYGVMNGTES
jgi:hypothetical protein